MGAARVPALAAAGRPRHATGTAARVERPQADTASARRALAATGMGLELGIVTSGRRRVPPNLLAAGFGLAGLGEAWQAATVAFGAPGAVANAINIVAAVAWLVITVAYLGQGWRTVLADLNDHVLGPFVSLVFVTPMLLGAGLYPFAPLAGRIIVAVFLVATVLIGGGLTGAWIMMDLDQLDVHPGYFLPSVAGGFVAADAAAVVGLRPVALAVFGVGLLSWVVLNSILLNRLFLGPRLPAPLVPTLAIEAAPPAVGGIAYLAIGGPALGTYILGGYTVLMVIVQLRLIPLYVRLRFSLSFWAFTFAYASVAAYAVEWLGLKHPAGEEAYGAVVLALITVFIAFVAVRNLILLARGQLLPARQPPPRS
jgi:tellurite resistance protein